jgi:hypothetical protein
VRYAYLLVAALLLLSSLGPLGIPRKWRLSQRLSLCPARSRRSGGSGLRWDSDRNQMHDALDLALLEEQFVIDAV